MAVQNEAVSCLGYWEQSTLLKSSIEAYKSLKQKMPELQAFFTSSLTA